MRTRLAVGRVIVYKSRGLDKTGGPFSYHTSLEPGHSLIDFLSVDSAFGHLYAYPTLQKKFICR